MWIHRFRSILLSRLSLLQRGPSQAEYVPFWPEFAYFIHLWPIVVFILNLVASCEVLCWVESLPLPSQARFSFIQLIWPIAILFYWLQALSILIWVSFWYIDVGLPFWSLFYPHYGDHIMVLVTSCLLWMFSSPLVLAPRYLSLSHNYLNDKKVWEIGTKPKRGALHFTNFK